MKRPKISVVIPTYNEGRYLAKCLKSLKQQDYGGEVEILVVDSSTDQTPLIAKRFKAKVAKIPRSIPALARQKGFAAAKGAIIATIDGDNEVDTNWLSEIEKEFKDQKIVCLFGVIHPLEGKFLDKILLLFYNLANWVSLKILGFTILTGTNQAVRSKAFAQAGGLKPLKLPDTHADIFDQTFLFANLRKIGKIKFDFGLKVSFSMRRFHQNGYLVTFWWGLRQWAGLHIWSGFGFPKLEPQKLSKSLGLALVLFSFLIGSVLILVFSLNSVKAAFDTEIFRQKIQQQVTEIKLKAEPFLQQVIILR